MTENPAARHYSEQQAGSLQSGHHLLLPDGQRSAEIQRVDVETDDFGTAALVLATLTGGGMLRIAAGSAVTVLVGPEDAAEGAADPVATPEGRPQDGAVAPGPGSESRAADAPTAQAPASVAPGTALPPAVVVPPLPARRAANCG